MDIKTSALMKKNPNVTLIYTEYHIDMGDGGRVL